MTRRTLSMRGRAFRMLVCSAALVLAPSRRLLQAQSCNVSGGSCSITLSASTTLSVGRFTHMTVGSTSLQLSNAASAVRSTDYQTGFATSNAVALTVWSTAPWTLKASGSSSPKSVGDFSFAGTSANSCPSAAAYVTLSGTATAANGVPGTAANTTNAGQSVFVCIRTALSWTGDQATSTIAPTLWFQVSSP